MADESRAFASGKLILSGEHAVVAGHRALALASRQGTTVTLTRKPGPLRVRGASNPALMKALAALVPDGFEVGLEGDLPIGRGMGSSASLAVACVRALAQLEQREATFEECFDKAFLLERVAHGTPSGLDHATVAQGGGLIYDPKGPSFEPIGVDHLGLVALDTGIAGNTAALVADVARRKAETGPILEEIGALTEQVIAGVRDKTPIGPLLNQNHRLLKQLGVSTPAVDALVAYALDHGALGAKLSGAGGGGVVIALVADPAEWAQAAEQDGLVALVATEVG